MKSNHFILRKAWLIIFLFSGYPIYQLTSWITEPVEKHTLIEENGLFDSEEELKITISGNLNSLLYDLSDGEEYYPLTLSYDDPEKGEISFPIESRTRGHFRRKLGGCYYLPLMLKFPKDKEDEIETGVFSEQKKMKLVMPCREEAYVYREWLAYKIYNLINPEKSFKTRLVRIDLSDEANDYFSFELLGFLLEEEKQLARRNNLEAVDKTFLRPEHTDRSTFLEMAVFQYLIGNTDWSTQFSQNLKFIAEDSIQLPYAVPYDFDHAGIVDAPYAKPPPDLNLVSTQERVYRGFCDKNLSEFEPVIEKFMNAKDDIYKLYTEADFLNPRYVERTVKFLDKFYKTIGKKKKWQKEFSYPCDPNGTGNIVIRGLKDDF